MIEQITLQEMKILVYHFNKPKFPKYNETLIMHCLAAYLKAYKVKVPMAQIFHLVIPATSKYMQCLRSFHAADGQNVVLQEQ